MTRSKYAAAFKDPRWQEKRLRIMERDKFKCRKCGDKRKTLNVHHLRYSGGKMPWDYEDKFLLTLCEDCHNEVENERSEVALLLADSEVFALIRAIRKFYNRHGRNCIGAITSVVESIGHAFDRKDHKQVEAVTDACHGIEAKAKNTFSFREAIAAIEADHPDIRSAVPETPRNFFAAMREACK